MRNDSRGSVWRQWDFHFHTPSSYDYKDNSVTDQQIVDGLVGAGISAVVITDHHVMDVARITNLQRLGGDKLTVFPGIEFRSELGGSETVHYIGIFPEDAELQSLWMSLQVKLNIAPQDIAKVGHDRIYVRFEQGADVIHELGGIVSVHAGRKSNSFENIRNTAQCKMAFKTDMMLEHIDLCEVGRAEDAGVYRDVIFKSIGARLPLVMGSDNHDIHSYTRKTPCWIKADCTFGGLCHVLHEPDDRVHLGDLPPSVKRVQGSKRKYVESISVSKVADSTLQETWFNGRIPLNTGFVAIIGNKGGGKSALADIIGLLGDSKKSDHFSFLCEEKFCQARANKAMHFEGEIVWASGKTARRLLSEGVDQAAVESVKYIPQSYLERVCNQVSDSDHDGFARELRTVIFSHVKEAERLGHPSLDSLLAYKTEEMTKSIALLTVELRESVKRVLDLEERNTPSQRKQIENLLDAKRAELAAHQSNRPPEVPKPQSDPALQQRAETDAALTYAETEIASLDVEIGKLNAEQGTIAKRAAAAEKLLARIKNLQTQVVAFERDSLADCQLLGRELVSLFSFEVNTAAVVAIQEQAARRNEEIQTALGASITGYLQRREKMAAQAAVLRDKLDEPSRKYQEYSLALREWQEAEAALVGSEDTAGSLKYYERKQKALEALPQEISTGWDNCFSTALAIYRETVKLADAYRLAFRNVQQFVETHHLAKDRFVLQFDASIACSGFDYQFLEHINQGRRGSFCGAEEGRDRVKRVVSKASFDTEEGVRAFLEEMRSLLVRDQRQEPQDVVRLADQLAKQSSPVSLMTFLFGLEYLKPQFSLRWAGKEIEQLSPGERGTLLLVFYLLIDRSDVPLVIDQPEENLDNHTVVDFLVPSIREAKSRRQIIIVTHNPNLAVVCDADQVIHASLEKHAANRVRYVAGSIENPKINELLVNILKGTRPAFDDRDRKYQAVGATQRRRFSLPKHT
jgi:ABC-type lipoprotein export system ATPase subunit